MAAACAIACEADALIFLTDVPGVKQADGSVMARLDTKQVAGLIDELVVSGGMMPKLEACLTKQDTAAIEASKKIGEGLSIDSTPTLFINGAKIDGAVPLVRYGDW